MTNALNVHVGAYGRGVPGPGPGVGDAKITCWKSMENSVPLPLVFELNENCCGVLPRGSHAGEMCGLAFLTNWIGFAKATPPVPNAIKAYEYPAQLVCNVFVDGVTPLPVVLKTNMYW